MFTKSLFMMLLASKISLALHAQVVAQITSPPTIEKRDYGLPDWNDYWSNAAKELSDLKDGPIPLSDLVVLSREFKYVYSVLESECSSLGKCTLTNPKSPLDAEEFSSVGYSGLLDEARSEFGTDVEASASPTGASAISALETEPVKATSITSVSSDSAVRLGTGVGVLGLVFSLLII